MKRNFKVTDLGLTVAIIFALQLFFVKIDTELKLPKSANISPCNCEHSPL